MDVSIPHPGHVPPARRTEGKNGGLIQVRSLASGGVTRAPTLSQQHQQQRLLPSSSVAPPRRMPPNPPPLPPSPSQIQQNGQNGGRTGHHPTASIRSLGSGRIRATSFGCGALSDWDDDPALYFDDNNSGSTHHQHDRDVNDLIINLSTTTLPLTKALACPTTEEDTLSAIARMDVDTSTANSVVIMETSRCSTVPDGFMDRPPLQQRQKMKHGQSNVPIPKQRGSRSNTCSNSSSRNRHFYDASTTPSNDNSYQHVIHGFLKGNNACYGGDDDDLSSIALTYKDGNMTDIGGNSGGVEVLDCLVSSKAVTASPTGQYPKVLGAFATSPLSPIRSLMTASFPKSLFVPAYEDSDDAVGAGAESAMAENDKNHGNGGGSISTSATRAAQREVQYWKRRLDHATKYYGKVHPQTAEATFNLGHAQLRNLHYDMALQNFTQAHAIWRSIHNDDRYHLSIGKALDAMGLAVLRSSTKQQQQQQQHLGKPKRINSLREAQRLLEQALAIRYHHLGVWHVDTVETYNKLASVQLHLGQLPAACHSYREVYYVRQAIFGRSHPSVAITAHAVANCFYRLHSVPQALEWYQRALDVYDTMQLPYQHPTVTKLLKDRSRLDQYLVG